LLGGRVIDAAFDLEPVSIQIGQTEAIADQSRDSLRGAALRGIVA
jgi:hypothetical protein